MFYKDGLRKTQNLVPRVTLKSDIADHILRERGGHQLLWNKVKRLYRTIVEDKMTERISVQVRQ